MADLRRRANRRVSAQRDPSPDSDDDNCPQQDPVRWFPSRWLISIVLIVQYLGFPHPTRSNLGVP